jgi:hypothetical protein
MGTDRGRSGVSGQAEKRKKSPATIKLRHYPTTTTLAALIMSIAAQSKIGMIGLSSQVMVLRASRREILGSVWVLDLHGPRHTERIVEA